MPWTLEYADAVMFLLPWGIRIYITQYNGSKQRLQANDYENSEDGQGVFYLLSEALSW